MIRKGTISLGLISPYYYKCMWVWQYRNRPRNKFIFTCFTMPLYFWTSWSFLYREMYNHTVIKLSSESIFELFLLILYIMYHTVTERFQKAIISKRLQKWKCWTKKNNLNEWNGFSWVLLYLTLRVFHICCNLLLDT